ncbi:MAG: DUF1275 domain-containing protein [Opitutaceae bacterium]|nr:DUF1275 domain-containing protein [Verrucomicrobiales bacterium]
MSPQKIPRWILISGFLLAGNAGFINAIAFLGMSSEAVSHVTGAITKLGIEAENQNWEEGHPAVMMVSSFLFGSILCGLIIRENRLKAGQSYGAALLVESIFLFVSYFCFLANIRSAEYFASAACGLQNALVAGYGSVIIRTTNMTGLVTDVGMLLGQFFHLKPSNIHQRRQKMRRLMIASTLLGGFFVGAIYGNNAYREHGLNAVLAPAIGVGLAGVGSILWRRARARRATIGEPLERP